MQFRATSKEIRKPREGDIVKDVKGVRYNVKAVGTRQIRLTKVGDLSGEVFSTRITNVHLETT